MKLEVVEGLFSVCRLSPTDSIPDWATKGKFFSISKSSDELSVVCEGAYVPEETKSEGGWSLLKVVGPLEFELTGILSSLVKPLADRRISIFAVSTFDTDYLMIKAEKSIEAIAALKDSGFHFES